ncbi:hypothetical protein [Bacillus sp. FJAT-42315]|uniref:hypothetical protein n=1 Tax=Bacillus sp. FJAT-42315 TaxID=2014077 RepID=UPI000C2517A7|nr:hypothetical protein [Bacillus sp. FJAT-42315]
MINKQKIRNAIPGLGLIFLLIGVVVYLQVTDERNKDLEQSVRLAMKKESVEEIDLNRFTDFDWEQAYLFSPYTPQEDISRQLGIYYKDPSSIDMRDDINLLVFLNKNKVVQYAEISREYGDLVIDTDDGLSPSNATLTIKKH